MVELEHIDPRNGVLVCGLKVDPNEVLADMPYNRRKINRFVPYRVCEYPAPENEGDLGEFLIKGEWVVCEFMVKSGTWWNESNRIGNGSVLGGHRVHELHPGMAKTNGEAAGKRAVETGQIKEIARAGGLAVKETEGYSERQADRGRKAHKDNPELASNNGKNTSSQRWKCLKTGHISNPGGLTTWQKKRSIDTSLRERVG